MNPRPAADAGPDHDICEGDSVLIGATGTNLLDYSWTATDSGFNSNLPVATVAPPSSNTYFLDVLDPNTGCTNVDTAEVTVTALPSPAIAGPDQQLTGVTTTTLAANTPVAGTGSWTILSGNATIDPPNSPTATVSGLSSGNNLLVWEVSNGLCPSNQDTVLILVASLEIPTGFSPNGDGVNDLFVIRGVEPLNASLQVFNRWGNKVYASNNYQNQWKRAAGRWFGLDG